MRAAPPFVLLAAAACAGGAGSGAAPGPDGRECEFAASTAEVADSVTQARAAGWGSPVDGDTTQATLSVRYGDDGRLAWVRALGPGRRAAALAQEVAGAIPPTAEPGLGLLIRYGRAPAPEARPGVFCPAEHRSPGDVTRAAFQRADFSQLRSAAPGELEFDVEVVVGPQGQPMNTRIRHRSGPMTALERLVADAAMQERYLPALHDGIPVAGSYTFEVRLRSRVRVVRRSG